MLYTGDWEKEWEARFDNSDGHYTAAIVVGKDFIKRLLAEHVEDMRMLVREAYVEGMLDGTGDYINERLARDVIEGKTVTIALANLLDRLPKDTTNQ